MPERFYLATAIDYTNGAPHIGHAYEKVLADVIARYRRLKGDKGDEVFFLTGVDQHGQKVQQSAEKAGISPQEFVLQNTEKFKALWENLGIGYHGWAATTEPRHKQCVQKILQRLHDEDQLYKAKQGGHYSVRQEQFLTDKERGPDGEFGPEWGEVEYREEENYYFKLAQHKQWLLGLIDSRADLITPGFRRAELRNAVEKLSGDLCVSRPKSRLSWGIEFPFDPQFVTYVWFDALVNYISFAPGEYDPTRSTLDDQPATFREWWPATIIIGKDILIPAHGIYWMIMLHALGFPDDGMPKLVVHGWWNISGAKMSKSLGNAVDPEALVGKYGAEALRYYLMAGIVTGQDSDFSEQRLIEYFNTWLANSVGNLLNRTLNMLHRYCEGRLPLDYEQARTVEPEPLPFLELNHQGAASHGVYRFSMDECNPTDALAGIEAVAREGNELIEQRAPWQLAKKPESHKELGAVLVLLVEALRMVAMRLSPIIPNASRTMLDQLAPDQPNNADYRLADIVFEHFPEGHRVATPTPVFPRIEGEAIPSAS